MFKTRLYSFVFLPTVLGLALPAQGVLTFRAPIVDGTSALSPPNLGPMPGLVMTAPFFPLSPTGFPIIQPQTTNLSGQVPIPLGYRPLFAQLSLSSDDLIVLRPAITPAGSVPFPQMITIDYSTSPYSVDLTQFQGIFPIPVTVAECNAYYHAQNAHEILTSLIPVSFPRRLTVQFEPFANARLATYSYTYDTIQLWAGSYDPNAAVVARSASVMAHEYGHRVVQEVYSDAGRWPAVYLDEGLADFLASVVAQTPLIGKDVKGPGTVIRDIDSNAQYQLGYSSPYAGGLVVAGALYHARQQFAGLGKASLFDSYIGPLVMSAPFDEIALLCRLLQLDDDDNDLTNGTPHSTLLHQAFTVRHGVPWPIPGCGGSASVGIIPAGWGRGGATPPQLAASLSLGSSSIDIQIMSSTPNQTGYLLVSDPPAAPFPAGSGKTIYIDPFTLLPMIPFRTDAVGRYAATFPLPPWAGEFAASALIVSPTAYLGHEVTNGLRVVP